MQSSRRAQMPVMGRHALATAAVGLGMIACLIIVVPVMHQRYRGPVSLRSLRSQTLPQFTQEEGEMKADDNIFDTEGKTPARHQGGDWTGHGGAAFKYLQSEASNPVEEAEDSLDGTLKAASPRSNRFNLYANWDSGTRKSVTHFADTMQRMRSRQRRRREQQDQRFFSGVQKAFGKKEGSMLMKEFDPQAGTEHKRRHRKEDTEAIKPFEHPGVIASGKKIKEMVRGLKKSGKGKAAIQSKMLKLQQSIEDDFKKVTAFGTRAKTRLSREEKAQHPKS